jgi:hypothetical protein
MPFAESFFRRAPSTPRLARSLRRLCREVDDRWPDRPTTSDGWLGDDAHLLRVSDHNADASGIVHALDVTVLGQRADRLVARAVVHPSTHYVIHRGQIWTSERDFTPHRYSGPDPHTSHVHVSIHHTDRAERSRVLWFP